MNRTDQYLATQVMTASPQQLYLMVLDGALRHARRAREACGQQDAAEASEALSTCRDFVVELMGGLNPEHAPELVEQVKGMFTSIYYQLIQADVHRDAARVDKVIEALGTHREAWLEVMAAVGQQPVQGGAGQAAESLADVSGGPKHARPVGLPGTRTWSA